MGAPNCWHDFPPTTPQLTLDGKCRNSVMRDKRLHVENSAQQLYYNYSLLLWATDVGGQPPNIEIFWFEGRFQPHVSKRDMRNQPLRGNEPWTPPLPIHGNRLGRRRACFGSQIVQECCDSVARMIFRLYLSVAENVVKDLPIAFQFLSSCSFKYSITWRYR